MTKPSIDDLVHRLIEDLRALQKRKGMHLYPVDEWALVNYLNGIHDGCRVFGFEIDRELWRTVAESRGWERSSAHPIRLMEAKGLSQAEMMDKLIEIEIDTLRELAKRPAQSDAGSSPANLPAPPQPN